MRKYIQTLKKRSLLTFLLFVWIVLFANAQIHLIDHLPKDSLIKWIEKEVKRFESSDSVYQITYQLLTKAQEEKDVLLMAKMHAALADLFYWNTKFVNVDSTLYHDQRALNYYLITNDSTKIAEAHQRVSSGYSDQNKYQEAQQHTFKAIAIYEHLEDAESLAYSYNSLSYIYNDLGAYSDAVKYANQAITIYEQLERPIDLAIALFYIAPAHIELQELDIALERANFSIQLIEENYTEEAIYTLTRAYTSRGNVYKAMKKYDRALADHLYVLELVNKNSNQQEPNGYEEGVADIYFLKENYRQAIPYYEAFINHANSRGLSGDIWQAKANLALCYEKTGNLRRAFAYQKLAWAEKDEMQTSKIDGLKSELQIKYETNKKEETIDAQKILLEQQSRIQGLTYGILALLSLLLGGIIWNYRKNQVKNQQLQALNTDLASKNNQNELLLKEIHHRVKNNLELVKSLLSLQSAQIEDPKVQAAIQASQNRVQSMGIIHQKLYQGKNLAAVEMKDYFLNLGEGILDSFAVDDRIQIECLMDELELDVDTAVPIGLIVNELLTNALKYAFPEGTKGKIQIELTENKDLLQLSIKDNGIGKQSGRAAEGTGFGTQLVSLLTIQLDGTMEEKVENGTVISFQFRKSVAA